jgi:hypothetical protein
MCFNSPSIYFSFVPRGFDERGRPVFMMLFYGGNHMMMVIKRYCLYRDD